MPKTKKQQSTYKPELVTYELDSDDFDRFLKAYYKKVVIVDDISLFYYGSPKGFDKCWIYLSRDRKEIVCCTHKYLSFKNIPWGKVEGWMQCRFKRSYSLDVNQTKADIRKTVSKGSPLDSKLVNGGVAYNKILKLLLKHYSRKEIDQCMAAHTANYCPDLKQQHYLIDPYKKGLNDFTPNYDGTIYKFKNCYSYDINGAHCSALCEIFPKAAKEIEALYKQRHKHPEIKDYFNLFVGMLNSKKHKANYGKTYNWIVQRTTKLLKDKIEHIGGKLIYINTDGFKVQNPENVDEGNSKLGDFKLEYRGDIYLCRTARYSLLQSNSLKGTLPLDVRNQLNIDLSTGQIPTYNVKTTSVTMPQGNTLTYRVISDIRLETREIVEK